MFELNDQVRNGRISGEVIQRLMENPDRYDDKLGRFGRRYDIMVNYDLGVDRLVAANKFNWKNNDVTSAHFPVERKGVREVVVEFYEFDRVVTGEEAAAQIEADGFVNEDVPTLLTFGKEHPIEQLRRPIVALGSRWLGSGGRWDVAFLDRLGGRRVLNLNWLHFDFYPDYRFLVFSKSAAL
ncbi:MAG TPA: hypothetical protein DEB73_02190 [Candidatus Magasanikbacteria bacterium]|nr:hypothetical protein [Candidatus Magasanikbacteria bacterium]HBX16448.1 hypothetical protein [Candidatus Magasanikbacteria bacterium]